MHLLQRSPFFFSDGITLTRTTRRLFLSIGFLPFGIGRPIPSHRKYERKKKKKNRKKIGKKFSHRASTVPTGTATFNSAGNSSGFAFRLLPLPSQQKNNNENTTSTKFNRSNFNRQLQPTNTYSTTIPTTTKRLQHDANDDQQQQNRDDDDRTIR